MEPQVQAHSGAGVWQVASCAALLLAAATARPGSSKPAARQPRVVARQALPMAPAPVVMSAAATPYVAEEPLIDLASAAAPVSAGAVDSVSMPAVVSRAALEEATVFRAPVLRAARRAGASRLTGGPKRSARRSQRSARRAVGAKLQAAPVVEPQALSFDASAVRREIQVGLFVARRMKATLRRESRSPTSHRRLSLMQVDLEQKHYWSWSTTSHRVIM